MCLIRSWPLRLMLSDQQISPFHRKPARLSWLLLCWSLGRGSLGTGFSRAVLLVCYRALRVSWTETPLVSHAQCFGGCVSGEGLKSWSAQCGVQSLCFSGESSVLSSLQLRALMPGVGLMARLCFSLAYLLQCGVSCLPDV